MTDHETSRDYDVIVEPIREPGIAQLVAVAQPKCTEHTLTETELRVAQRIARDMTPQEIASDLNISPSTVGTHSERIRKKLSVRGIAGITRFVINNRLDL